ncbi:probable elongation factor 1-delta isoform X5 [Topomyia yanbarensis]|uniref:probable elongation factor 1-delta isoform X5 n=1 Tax=Topomyia yanbarensis TaxID=2498891 RepID=UPI00273B3E93|nr:probable elongation factor 1-delta isoform X5 [Topomyia yanbarensis]
MISPMACDKYWTDKANYDNAEKKYYEYLAQLSLEKKPVCPTVAQKIASATVQPKPEIVVKKDQSPVPAIVDFVVPQEQAKMNSFPTQCTLASEISKARQHIKNSLERMDGIAALAASPGAELLDRLSSVEKENDKLRSVIDGLNNLVIDLHARVKALESEKKVIAPTTAVAAPPAPEKKVSTAAVAEDDDDDDVDLFGSDDEEEDDKAAELREKRLAEYAAKKSKKPALIAKSNVILDIKPWDDETDMKVMEQEVRKISMDGLLLGASKLVPLAYGIHKLQLSCVIEDDKVSVDELQEKIEAIEEYVQSVDIAAFNKI